MSSGKKRYAVIAGVVSVALGFGIDAMSSILTMPSSSTKGGSWWYLVTAQTRAEALSHLGIALMVFGLTLIAAAAHAWLREPSKQTV